MRAVWRPDGIPPGHRGTECGGAEEKRAGYQSAEVYAGLTQAKCVRGVHHMQCVVAGERSAPSPISINITKMTTSDSGHNLNIF